MFLRLQPATVKVLEKKKILKKKKKKNEFFLSSHIERDSKKSTLTSHPTTICVLDATVITKTKKTGKIPTKVRGKEG